MPKILLGDLGKGGGESTKHCIKHLELDLLIQSNETQMNHMKVGRGKFSSSSPVPNGQVLWTDICLISSYMEQK